MEAYLEKRSQLIHEDRSQRVDFSRGVQPSSAEIEADRIVRAIRATEAISVWGVGSIDIRQHRPEEKATDLFPGMAFLTARDTIVRTKLFNILQKMPKGGLLHAHLDATVNARVLLRLALDQPLIHVRVATRLTADNLKTNLPAFRALPQAEFTDRTSLTSESYVDNEWVQVGKARANFPEELGGPEGFDEWVVGAFIINPQEAYETHNTTDKIWSKFSSTFVASTGLILFIPVFKAYVREFFLSSIADGISYVEARVNFWYKTMTGENGQNDVPHREWLRVYDEVLKDVKDSLKREGREDEFVGSKIIYTTLRHITCEELEWALEDCIALKQEFPHLIAGFDLVGHEDSYKPLIDYLEPLTRFVERQKELGIDIPFIFHAGETLGDGSPADMNLYDAILLGTKRIGHGFSLVKHPKLIELCKERNIAVEVCPISNEILRLTSSMPMHPLPILMNHGVPVALSSDDPAVFGNMGLTFDYFQVLVASEVTGLITLGEMAQDSIRYSSLDEDDKKHALSLWKKRWNAFIEKIILEHESQK